jgi:twitching motility protein PilT
MATTDALTLERILTTAAEYQASDVHLTVGTPPMLRVDGKLVALEQEGIVTPDILSALVEQYLDPSQREALERDKELVTSLSLPTRVRFKISLFHQKGSLSASVRLIPQTIKSLRELGLPPEVERFAQLTKGLVLITGPFGSGRSLTLAALVNTINQTRGAHVITIEKPIEILYVNLKSVIEQREVGRDTTSFQQALEMAEREDVDVVALSEMEEPEVIVEALRAAASSRLVLSTMNTDSVMKTVETILASFPADQSQLGRTQLSESLQGIISQRLLPRVGGGRIAVAEIIIPNPAVRALIRDGSIFQLQNILQTSREEGMRSLDRSLAELVKTGEILLEDALTHAVDRNALKTMIHRTT